MSALLDLASGAYRTPAADIAAFVVQAPGLTVIGAVLAWKRPRNPIGWLFLAAGVAIVHAAFADSYGRYGLLAAMTTTTSTGSSLQAPFDDPGFDEAQLAAASFLARYSGRTLEAYRHDLRGFFQWLPTTMSPCSRRPGAHEAT